MVSLSHIGSVLVFILAAALAVKLAYEIRLYAITTYGRVIHEFDPYFNFRATQYLAQHGLDKFFKWFDHMSWYPLGRPVGTTIYPGMQMVAVAIWTGLKQKFWKDLLGTSLKMTLNDVCVFIPAWFGSVASVVVGLMTREASGSYYAGAAAAVVMAVIPAHLMRSIGGGYDNESVAMTAMCLTFWLWLRSLRTSWSWPLGVLAGLAYAFMAAAWGGYIFVGNMVAVHAAALVALGRFTPALRYAYSLWFLTGTLLASFIPVVGWAPYRSLEQAAPLLVFIGMHLLAAVDAWAKRTGMGQLRARFFAFCIAVGACTAVLLLGMATGIFGDLSVRVRSLFLKHTKTGNPLVDSVAEHQAASTEAYRHYLHHMYSVAPIGFVILLLRGASSKASGDALNFGVPVAKWFLILYAVVGYYFSARMARLIILLGPVASGLAGVAIASGLQWAAEQVAASVHLMKDDAAEGDAAAAAAAGGADAAATTPAAPAATATGKEAKGTPSKAKAKAEAAAAAKDASAPPSVLDDFSGALSWLFAPAVKAATTAYRSRPARHVRLLAAAFLLYQTATKGPDFYRFSDQFAQQISQPSLMFKARLQNGQEVIVNDYQEAYIWLRDNTPKDARVLSWWDYGYQIAGISNRTTLADGNTWNLEHIALIGRILTSPVKKSHELARHLADYVLVWAGNQGDDLAKSPHMARIGSSVFPDICPNDPLCRHFGFYGDRKPTPSMEASLLYRLHSSGVVPGVTVDESLYQHVYSSKYGLVRIYKVLNISEESRAWAADPANRVCDAPGSWYCVGRYPPGLPLQIPKTHRSVDVNNPENYVENLGAAATAEQPKQPKKKASKKAAKKGAAKSEL